MTAIHVKPPPELTPAADLAHAMALPSRVYGPRTTGERQCRNVACGRALPPGARRHECSRCAVRKSRGVVVANLCAVCGHDDPRVLGRVALADGPVTACANCAALAGRRRPTLATLRGELVRAA